jgi:hypothetical protein
MKIDPDHEVYSIPKLFFFVDASSGKGKSQLAESVDLPVIYIPLTYSQAIYKCFKNLSEHIHSALELDKKSFGLDPEMESIRSQFLSSNLTPFITVGLLLELFKLVYGKSNEESLKLLSGFDSVTTFTYKPMTLQAARIELKSLVDEGIVGSLCKIPLFIIDEVPSKTENTLYHKCILLRNLIRCMGLVCLLSGTEAAAMNAIDNIHLSSRQGILNKREYLRLILKLPPTNWNIFQSDPVYGPLIQKLKEDVCAMLKRTRPLFLQYVLDAMLQSPTVDGQLTVAVLRAAKILLYKTNFTSFVVYVSVQTCDCVCAWLRYKYMCMSEYTSMKTRKDDDNE